MSYGIVDWEFFDDQDLARARGFGSADEQKIAYVNSTRKYYVLANTNPIVWVPMAEPRNASPMCAIRETGITANASIAATFTLCRRAPAHYDAVQVILHGAVSGANTFKVSVAPSSQFNNGWQPLNAAGAAQAFTNLTFGTTDPLNPRNPGGGAATTTTAGTSGTNATQDLIEGSSISDILNISSLARTDNPAADPLIFVRVFGTNAPAINVTEADTAGANPWNSAIPDFYCGYWGATDYTTATPPGAPSQQWLPSLTIVFWLRGKRVYTIGATGDSIEQGWIPAASVPQFGGNINGWPRRFVKLLNDNGISATLVSLSTTGAHSKLFHERAVNAILAGKLTHLFIKPWSVNETANGDAAVPAALARTSQLIELCHARGVVPILVQPWGGQSNGTTMRNTVDAYVAGMAASGVAVFDPRSVTDTSSGALIDSMKNLNNVGAVVDSLHINDSGYDIIANNCFHHKHMFGIY